MPSPFVMPTCRCLRSPAEWKARVDLAACYRPVAHYGMADMMANHISARTDEDDAFLINAYGLMYEKITASSQIKVGHDGTVIAKPDFGELDTLKVLRAGRARRNDQYMIVLTNYATPDIRLKSSESGADAVFDKSTEIDQFMELCRQYSTAPTVKAANAPSAQLPGEANEESLAREKAVGVGDAYRARGHRSGPYRGRERIGGKERSGRS